VGRGGERVSVVSPYTASAPGFTFAMVIVHHVSKGSTMDTLYTILYTLYLDWTFLMVRVVLWIHYTLYLDWTFLMFALER
jgi:hypothetical protein